jgi:NADH dehydrogenase
MRGADAVVSAVHGFAGTRGAGPAEVDYLGNVHLAEAAAAHGVRRFILISVYDARADSPMELHRAKFAAESYLRRTALDWTIIRPTAFLETWLQVIANEPGGLPLVFGSGRNPINFVSVSDVASAVDNALTSTAAIGRVMNVTGPQNLTMLEMAHACSGRRVKRIPRTALRVMGQLARPISPAFARQARTALAMDSIDMTARTGDSPDTVRRSLADVPPDSTK